MKNEQPPAQGRAEEAFRFLKHEEFAALSREERNRYLQRALEAIRSGHPLDDLPTKDPQ